MFSYDRVLPIGSVVFLKGAEQRDMITADVLIPRGSSVLRKPLFSTMT